MNNTIFISHAGVDKKRIAPYLARIMDEIPQVNLWIDRPEEVPEIGGFKFDRNRIEKIPAGEDWLKEIIEKADKVSLVLSFWTKNCISEDKKVLRREVEAAYKAGKLLPLRLDQSARYHLETVQDISFYNANHKEKKFQTCIENIRTRLKLVKPRTNDRLALEEIPFLADRKSVSDIIFPARSGLKAYKHFIVPYEYDDLFDKFIWRVCDYNGPLSLIDEINDQSFKWEHINFHGDCTSEKEFYTRIRQNFELQHCANRIERAMETGTQICISTSVKCPKGSSIDSLGSIWKEFLDEKTEHIRQRADVDNLPYLFSIMGVSNHKPGRFGRILSSLFSSRPKTALNSLADGRIEQLECLEKISEQHMEDWKMDANILECCGNINKSIDRITQGCRKLFKNSKNCCTMSTFAEEVTANLDDQDKIRRIRK